MTDITQQQQNLPATQADVTLGAPEGLEDFDTSDRVMPMLRIDHHENVFVDALSGEKYPTLNVILLGLVKQRVLWPAQLQQNSDGDADPPLCRSYNFKEGHPSKPEVFANGTTAERFPWDATQFEQGTEILPCGQCPLKEWGSHPTRDAPWCSEQHTFALVIPQEDGNMVPCLFQLQRSGLKSSRQYLSSFANANQPLFTVFTSISLEQKKYGNNPFSVPKFARNGAVDQNLFPEFSTMYRNIREYLQTPRSRDEEEGEDTMSTESSVQAPVAQAPQQAPQAPQPAAPAPTTAQAAPAAPQTAPAAPQQAAAPAPAPEAAPAPQQPAQTPAPAVEETPQQPAAAPGIAPGIAPQAQPTAAPAAAPAPEQPAPQPPQAPAPEPAPTPAPAPAAADDDEIPF